MQTDFNFSEIDIFLNKNIKNFDKDKIDNIISRIKKKRAYSIYFRCL